MIANLLKGISLGRREDMKWGGGAFLHLKECAPEKKANLGD